MYILQIRHAVSTFDAWKRAFDADPIDRKGSGVRRYRVYRDVLDANFVTVDLELDDRPAAEALRAKLRRLWDGPGRAFMRDPEARILEPVASVDV